MARIRRMVNPYQPTIYHIMSRTALDGFPLTDVDKEYLVGLIEAFSKLYLVDALGFCIMDNHFHLMIRMYPDDHLTDEDLLAQIKHFYGKNKSVSKNQLPFYRSKLKDRSKTNALNPFTKVLNRMDIL